MLLLKDSFRKTLFVVGLQYRYTSLEDDGAAVEVFIDKMYCTPGHFNAIIECLALTVQAGK